MKTIEIERCRKAMEISGKHNAEYSTESKEATVMTRKTKKLWL